MRREPMELIERFVEWDAPDPPPGWEEMERSRDGCSYRHRMVPMTVICSRGLESDGQVWTHLSIAEPHQMPKWGEVKRIKELFLGDVYAVIVLPPKASYVNIHPYCIHLFAPVESGRWPLPEFSAVVPGVGRTL